MEMVARLYSYVLIEAHIFTNFLYKENKKHKIFNVGTGKVIQF